MIVSLKVNIFRSLDLRRSVPVSGKYLWLVFSELFEERWYRFLKRLIWMEGGYGYTQKKLHAFFKWVFNGKFSWQTKVSRFRVVFHLANFFGLTNVSVQVILFPLNLVFRSFLTLLAWKVKEALWRCWFCWFSLCIAHSFEVFLRFFQ